MSGSLAPSPVQMMWPVKGILPVVGLIPAVPQKVEGTRMLPPVSLPMSKGEAPAAIAAAAPPLLPPGDFTKSYGFLVKPNSRFLVS